MMNAFQHNSAQKRPGPKDQCAYDVRVYLCIYCSDPESNCVSRFLHYAPSPKLSLLEHLTLCILGPSLVM